MADDVKVKLGADTGQATAGMASAASQIDASLEEVNKHLEALQQQSERSQESMIKGLDKVAEGFGELKGHIGEVIEDVTGRIEVFKTLISSIASSVGGGVLFKEMVDSTLKFEDSVLRLSNAFGLTAEKAVLLDTQLKLAGADGEQFAKTALNIGRRIMADGGEAFDRLGVKVRDANQQLLPMQDIMDNVYHRLLQFKAGTDQEMASLELTGRSALNFTTEMERMNRTKQRAIEIQKELNLEMGAETIANIERYRIEVNAFKIVLDDLGDRLGRIVLPHLERMAKWLAANAEGITTVVVVAFKVLITVLEAAGMAISELIAGFIVLYRVAASFSEAWGAIWDVITGKSSWAQVKTTFANIELENRKAVNRMLDIWQRYSNNVNEMWRSSADAMYEHYNRALYNIENRTHMSYQQQQQQGMVRPLGGTLPYIPKPKGGGASDDRLKEWQDELLAMREAEGYFHEFSKAQEADFWRSKFALTKAGLQADVEIRRQIHRLIFEADKDAAHKELNEAMASFQLQIDEAKHNKDAQIAAAVARTATIRAILGEEHAEYKRVLAEEVKLRQDWLKREQEIARIHEDIIRQRGEHEIAMGRLAYEQDFALQKISAEQRFQLETQSENALFAIRMQAEQEKLALMESDTKEYANQLKLIEALEQKHQETLTQIANRAVQERLKAELQAADQIRGAFEGLFSSMQTNIKDWKQNFLNALQTIQKAIADMISKKLVEQLLGAGTPGGDLLGSILGTITGTGGAKGQAQQLNQAGLVLTKAGTGLDLAATQLQAAATALSASSASGGLQSIGGFSGFGDFMSPDLMDAIPFFDQGTPYVKNDTLAYVHRGEAIIPASMNRGGGGATSNSLTQNFHVSGAKDTRTQDQIFTAAARGVKRAQARNM